MVDISWKGGWYKIFHTGIYNRTAIFPKKDLIEKSKSYSDNTYFCYRNPKIPGAKFICFQKEKAINKLEEFDDSYMISERAPNKSIIIQGEYDGEHAEVSFIKEPMRFALQKERIRISRVQLIDLITYENYRLIDEIHEVHCTSNTLGYLPIVEFSYYSEPIGINHENLIIWEIRNY